MGFWAKLKGELIDIIEWPEVESDLIVWKFPRYGNEIKNGAKLVVREGQVAIFVNEGELADVFPPGTYTLETKNLPILSTLQGWKYGFNSPFKAEVYFVSTRVFTNQKWGTPNAFYVEDPKYGAISLRAFGTYSFQVVDAVKFFKDYVGPVDEYPSVRITDELRNAIIANFQDAVGESGITVAQLSGKIRELQEILMKYLQKEFNDYGLKIIKFFINSITMPKELEEYMHKGAKAKFIGNVDAYKQVEMAEAMGNIGKTGNYAGGVEGLMGMAMMQMMMNQQQTGQAGPMTPPPMANYYIAVNGQQIGPLTIEQIRQMAANGQITPNTYVWKQGFANWMLISQVPELAAIFGQAAPPPPPPPPGSGL